MKELTKVRHRCRIIQLLDALEQVGINPISAKKLHAFAYLANVLSPVWELPAFDGIMLKSDTGPHYKELQNEMDTLVGMGLVNITDLTYTLVEGGAQLEGNYELRFESENLHRLLAALGSDGPESCIDKFEAQVHNYLVELAGALSVLPEDEIDVAAKLDATYASDAVDFSNVIVFEQSNVSYALTQKFEDFLPENSKFSPGEKIYLYASYLNRKLSA